MLASRMYHLFLVYHRTKQENSNLIPTSLPQLFTGLIVDGNMQKLFFYKNAFQPIITVVILAGM